MSDFVVRGVEKELFQLFKARMAEKDLTFGEWLVGKMMEEVYRERVVNEPAGDILR